ncbi:MAG TPA: hypothetical protein VK879_19635 [Candidatus Sulfomarinibacteraceae bacterium]|nr:hypothetical protein [Candidatus Sulfomarinibacteraceae bacterium]
MTTGTHEKSEQQKNGEHNGNMFQLAERLEAHYTAPSPQATAYAPNFFPRLLDHGIFWGLLLGAVFGVLFAWLVHSGRLTPSGWEGLFSLTPFTFYAFWAFAGAALGLLIGGLTTLLLAQPPPLEEPGEPEDDS